MRAMMVNDRAKHNVLPLSKFCVMQITRQRVRPVTFVDVEETCPTCYGKGRIKPSILFTDQLESKIAIMVNKLGIKNLLFMFILMLLLISNRVFFLRK